MPHDQPDTTGENLLQRCRHDPRWASEEIARFRAWLRYIEGNFRDGPECAREALRGDATPDGFHG